MENFASLRQGVADDDECVRGHHARIKAFQDTQAMLAAQSALVSVRESARNSARDSARSTARGDDTGNFPDTATARSTCRSDNPFASARSTNRSEKDLTTFPMSALQSMGHEHPDILAKARAQRAVKYVTTLKNPLVPPAYNSVSSRQGFFPAGTNTLHTTPAAAAASVAEKKKQSQRLSNSQNARSSGKIVATSRDVDTSRLKESLNSLVEELAKTDAQIARQELKIALAPKVKTFEKKQSSARK